MTDRRVELDQAIHALLSPARGVIDRHTRDERHQCRRCGQTWPCVEMDTALAALDLVLRVHAAALRGSRTAPR